MARYSHSEETNPHQKFNAHRLIDFHSHLLPQMDDGSKSVEESLQMMEASARQGVCCIVVTPHFYASNDTPKRFLDRRAQSFARLNQRLRSTVPVLIPGAEVQYFSGITQMEDLPRLCIGKSNLLLLEMPFKKWSSRVVDDVLTLGNQGNLRIVIAHIDRYLQEQPKGTLEHLVNNNILIQANAEYFLPIWKRRKALQLLENGYIHFLGSDCHNMDSRPPRMGDCFRVIRSKLDDDALFRMQTREQELLLRNYKLAQKR